jgi:hypothetical protein
LTFSVIIPTSVRHNVKISNILEQPSTIHSRGKTANVFGDEPSTYGEYILCSKKIESFSIQKVAELLSNDGKPLVMVFVSSNLMPHIEAEINVYYSTLIDVGYDTIVFEISGTTVEKLKDQILYYWDNGYNLAGVVLIGNFPVAWYSHDEEFPCDLFLMDMDGKWIDTDGDGLYDSHTNGDGDTAPEIYIGRIDASNMPSNEKGKIGIIKKYLNKVHEFWIGNISQTDFALTYTDHDWSGCDDIQHDIGYLYENYDVITYPDVNRNDYLDNRLPDSYEFIQLACHSKSFGHLFDNGGLAFCSNIQSAPPMALFFNLYCCYALRFTDYNCLGNAYILNTNSPSLAVVGSTKSGSMRDFRYFYESFGQGFSFGMALQSWFEHKYPYNEYDVASYYGLTILGDPTLIVYKNYRADAHGPYYTLIDIPIQFSGSATGGIPPYAWFWDFDDGNTSTVKNPKHKYTRPGNYTVTLTIKDSEDNNASDITWAKIKGTNNPPNPPTISGPTSGKPWTKYYYDFTSVDFDGDEWVEYIIDWGDESYSSGLGPYKLGEVIKFYHKWNKKGTYYIRAIATDPYGAQSEWSDPLEVTMPKNKALNFNFNLLSWLFERFPRIFPMIRLLFDLN